MGSRSRRDENLEVRVLFAREKEEDFYIVRDVLRQRDSMIQAEINQAFSIEQTAEEM